MHILLFLLSKLFTLSWTPSIHVPLPSLTLGDIKSAHPSFPLPLLFFIYFTHYSSFHPLPYFTLAPHHAIHHSTSFCMGFLYPRNVQPNDNSFNYCDILLQYNLIHSYLGSTAATDATVCPPDVLQDLPRLTTSHAT